MCQKSDWDTLSAASDRTPESLVSFASNAKANGISVIFASADGAAHLPGMVAVLTPLP
jgi:5-(carboxyamino)imidazole ribonucleotide mutase